MIIRTEVGDGRLKQRCARRKQRTWRRENNATIATPIKKHPGESLN